MLADERLQLPLRFSKKNIQHGKNKSPFSPFSLSENSKY
jgi:hypothetical protein